MDFLNVIIILIWLVYNGSSKKKEWRIDEDISNLLSEMLRDNREAQITQYGKPNLATPESDMPKYVLAPFINGIVRAAAKFKHNLKPKRRQNKFAMVEVGPGAFKVTGVKYPKDTFANDLKKLIQLKQRMEERNKDLNV